MSKQMLISKANQDTITAMLIRSLGGGSGVWSVNEATRLERRAEFNVRKIQSRQVTRGISRVAME